MKRIISIVIALILTAVMLAGCGGSTNSNEDDELQITIFAASSLSEVMSEITDVYIQENPDVSPLISYEGSSTLMTQIAEGGAECDVFVSAAETQVNKLEEEGYLVKGTRRNLLNNQLCVVTYPGSDTKVTGLKDMDKAESLAIADGTVPIGEYTRRALIHEGILPAADDMGAITSTELSHALGGVDINNCADVYDVVSSVVDHSNEVGTVYYSDMYGREDRLQVLEMVPNEITGDIIYPAVQVKNPDADEEQTAAAADFMEFLGSDKARNIFEKYHFNVIE